MVRTDHQLLEEGKGYRLVLEIKHAEILDFITQHLRPVSFPLLFFYIFNGFILLGFTVQIVLSIADGTGSISAYLGAFLAGTIFFMLVIIPVHELIHLLTFKLMGAKQTRVFAQWEKFLFYAVADKFVMNHREFIWLALPPFVLLNSLLLIALLLIDGPAQFAVWSALIFHSTGCVGDFVLIAYLSEKNRRNYLSFDDLKKGVTLFYVPIEESGSGSSSSSLPECEAGG
ncbi:MAG: DUF3267 domain-containing protein [Bacteroidales bacterium]